ncbi:uncharacterized protein BDR25DRAFT_332573 [Lindgomyces ingoldianus]|uniref:Uncharacterized protein n=1 Tax=Lindgomyces ingoldianus TaxID=673940 RepID=A0ACB6R652_9PLEO|nr:uncharacterized protein BDR25DRAFT_332573 [Lindgomyces ingoldianus]KAF2473782.1 hypothetical protein BDR25DRAFT_332573 [Lindgomyces ingoldianus]
MVVVNPEPAALSASDLSLFYTTDDLLSNSPVLIFYGPTATSTQATHSRIQAHIFTPAGLQNFARLIISPTAPFYSAVTCLPREEQGDEICRGLAFSLYKYFVELPAEVKNVWEMQYNTMGRLHAAPKLFSESHAAMIAARMVRLENVADIIVDIRHALGEQTLSWLDLDVVLPQGAMRKLDDPRESAQFDEVEDDILQQRFGIYASVVKLFGEAAFLPTSKLRRAPSKPTSLNRSQSFSRNQKENLRREMCELLDTEENYVSKIYDLIHSVAADFRQKAKLKSVTSASPSEQALRGLFPPSLDKILEVNSNFLEAIRTILEDTENDAIQDIETATDDIFVAPLRGQKDPLDVTGAAAVAKALVEWFPQFGECYTDYVGAHAEFSQFLKVFMKDTGSSFSKRVHETGEQRLMSMLIEPVQRLPRYNLYIDNIIKQLPVRHPAIKTFLKARDIISEICSRDAPSAQQIKVFDRLRKLVFSWPPSFNPQGRLITAIDFVELSPPYHGELQGPASTSGIFLLFTDFLVMLHKPNGCTITARSVIADLDNPKFVETFSGTAELIFHQQLKLSDVFLSEHSDGSILQLLSPTPPASQPGRPRSRDRRNLGLRMFYLLGAYEAKAQKCIEEVTKARVEGRYPEAERESQTWEVRNLSGDLSFFSAISEDVRGQTVEGRKEPAKIQIIVDPSKFPCPVELGDNGIEMTVSISVLEDGLFLLETTGINGYAARDKLTNVEFLPVLTKRLGNFLQLRNNIKNPNLAEAYLFRNQQILKSLKLQIDGVDDDVQDGKSRPHSPVKMLSNLFGGSVGKDGGNRKLQRNPPSLSDIQRMAPPLLPAPTRTHSRDGELSRPTSSSKTIGFNANTTPTDGLVRLEETLATLILALHARKGNIVGRSVRARSIADELAVNEVYNSLLENPANLDIAAQSSVDVLFAAFEKFLKIAWREKMGPVISQGTLVSLQLKSDSMYPGEFEDFFRTTFNEIAPQNQRSLRAIIKLLAELLDGTGNDGDRGILTAAFAEMLVPEGNPNDFISLIDRFIQDIDALFSVHASGVSTPMYGSVDSKGRSIAGSVNSNTSLRKRFGFGTLSRENSKSEHESKVGSLWRSLSKNSHGLDSTPSSLSRAGPPSLGRSNSTDTNVRISPKRPSSRDRPTVLGAFSFENNQSPHARTFLGAALGTIGEVPSTTGPPRKKRRSSLSDLKTLQSANDAPTWSPQTPRRPDSSHRGTRQTSASPRTPSRNTPSPIKHSHIPTPTRMGSPTRKENSPANVLDRAGSVRPKSTPVKPDEVTIKTYSPVKKRTESVSGIPMLKPTSSSSGLTERPTSGNTVKIPPSTPRSPTKASASASPPKKLKMQSPQKLRERLQNQQRDIQTASKDLQAELSLIGHELTARPTPRLTTQISAPPSTSAIPNKAAEARLVSIEKTLKSTLEALSSRTASIANDVTTSLQVSEARAKHLDQLYRDMNAENEALYARFNEELEKVERSVRKGGGNEEVDRRMKASEEECARLRKENARLKREVAGLKAQIRE